MSAKSLIKVLLAFTCMLGGSLFAEPETTVDAGTIDNKILCGYQGWHRCAGDASGRGWSHWNRDPINDPKIFDPKKVVDDLWPDVSEYDKQDLYPVPGFTYPDGSRAYLFTTDSPRTVLRHFTWMKQYGIDGVFVVRFVVSLPGGPAGECYRDNLRVLNYVREAAARTGRVWAVDYDLNGMKNSRNYLDMIKRDWKQLVDEGYTKDPNYLHEGGKPVVHAWSLYSGTPTNPLTPEVGDFFTSPGPYQAYFVGGCNWNWSKVQDEKYKASISRANAITPWDVGSRVKDSNGVLHAENELWAGDQKECNQMGVKWIPVIFPGFSWANVCNKPFGTDNIPRRKGQFFWEQFAALSKLGGVNTVYVAMFDEVDEGTAIFKLCDKPPVQANFVGNEGMPADWYLRLTGEGMKYLLQKKVVPAEIPIRP